MPLLDALELAVGRTSCNNLTAASNNEVGLRYQRCTPKEATLKQKIKAGSNSRPLEEPKI
jgi:hypothetical protein